jgi:hypothetical protein
MAADLKYLREHYASLSDEALREIKRADLVDAAQKCYDDEVKQRQLARQQVAEPDQEPELDEAGVDTQDDSEHPDWLEEAAEVFSRTDHPGHLPAEIADARDVLEEAGIPCNLDFSEIPEVENTRAAPTHVWRLLVPGNLNLLATNVLERDIFNKDFELTWKTHLETMSNQELHEMSPEVVFCGLFDRVERVRNAYDNEMVRRGLKSRT